MLRRLRRTLKRPTVFRLALTAICAELPLPTDIVEKLAN